MKMVCCFLLMTIAFCTNAFAIEPKYVLEAQSKENKLFRLERKKAKGNALQYVVRMEQDPAILLLEGKLIKERKGNLSMGAEVTAAIKW